TAVTFAPHQALVIAGTQTGQVLLWDLSDPAHPMPRGILPGRSAKVVAVKVSADGRLLAVAADKSIRLWRPNGGRPGPPGELTGPTASLRDIAITPDGRGLAAGGDDQTVRMWDITDPTRPAALPNPMGPASKIFSMAISPNGRTLVAGTALQHQI